MWITALAPTRMGMGARVLPAVRLSTLIHARHESTVSSSEPNEEAQPSPAAIRYPYYVSRVGMSGLSLPVYTDIRHGGSQWFTQIRKVEGDAAVCIHVICNTNEKGPVP